MREIQVGILNKIEYPKISFRLRDESFVKLYSIINAGERIIVAPDMDDMTGEIEKINRLRDSLIRLQNILKHSQTHVYLLIYLMPQKPQS